MCAKILSEDEILELRNSPYIINATAREVHFTAAFKERFLLEHQKGKLPKQILLDMGIDPEMLGQTRINSIKERTREQAMRGKRVTEVRSNSPAKEDKDETSNKQIARIEHEVSYLKQELEFVKRILKANREAQEEWKSRHHRGSNMKSSEE